METFKRKAATERVGGGEEWRGNGGEKYGGVYPVIEAWRLSMPSLLAPSCSRITPRRNQACNARRRAASVKR